MNRINALLSTSLLLFTLPLGCGTDETPPEEPIRVGVIVSLTGLVNTDDGVRNAALMAAREINAAGGVDGRELELVVRDDMSDENVAREAARELIENEGVVAIVGPTWSDASREVLTVSAPAEVPILTCCSTSPALGTEENGYFFRTAPSDDLQGVVVARELRNLTPACENLAIIYATGTYGDAMADVISTEFEVLGGTVVASQPLDAAMASYRTEVDSVKAMSPDCVALVAFVETGGAVMRTWYTDATPGDVRWIGTDSLKDQEGFAREVADTSLIDGFIGTAPDTTPMTPEYQAFFGSFQTLYPGTAVDIFEGPEYDATAIIGLAIANISVADGENYGVALRRSIFEVARPADTGTHQRFGPNELGAALNTLSQGGGVNYDGAAGPLDFDSRGNVIAGYGIWQFNAADGTTGEITTIRTIDAASIQD